MLLFLLAYLGGILPTGGFDLIRAQIEALTAESGKALSFSFVIVAHRDTAASAARRARS